MVYTDKKILVADYFQELVAFGRVLGMGPELLQDSDRLHRRTHFKITSETTLARAMKLGAKWVQRRRAIAVAAAMNRDGEREIMRECDTDIHGHDDVPVINGRTGQTELL